jgi:hypothetical protein
MDGAVGSIAYGTTANMANVSTMIFFKTSMRTKPTIAIYATDGTPNTLGNDFATVNHNIAGFVEYLTGKESFMLQSSATATAIFAGHYTASAEL